MPPAPIVNTNDSGILFELYILIARYSVQLAELPLHARYRDKGGSHKKQTGCTARIHAKKAAQGKLFWIGIAHNPCDQRSRGSRAEVFQLRKQDSPPHQTELRTAIPAWA
jgi:hypothetical protein